MGERNDPTMTSKLLGQRFDGLTEVQLRTMLETTFVFEERKQIRDALRKLKKNKVEGGKNPVANTTRRTSHQTSAEDDTPSFQNRSVTAHHAKSNLSEKVSPKPMNNGCQKIETSERYPNRGKMDAIISRKDTNGNNSDFSERSGTALPRGVLVSSGQSERGSENLNGCHEWDAGGEMLRKSVDLTDKESQALDEQYASAGYKNGVTHRNNNTRGSGIEADGSLGDEARLVRGRIKLDDEKSTTSRSTSSAEGRKESVREKDCGDDCVFQKDVGSGGLVDLGGNVSIDDSSKGKVLLKVMESDDSEGCGVVNGDINVNGTEKVIDCDRNTRVIPSDREVDTKRDSGIVTVEEEGGGKALPGKAEDDDPDGIILDQLVEGLDKSIEDEQQVETGERKSGIKSGDKGLESGVGGRHRKLQSKSDSTDSGIHGDAEDSVDRVIDFGELSVKEEEDGRGPLDPGKEEVQETVQLEDIEDETELRRMLDSSYDFEERRKIRAAMRALKKKHQSRPAEKKPAPQQSYLTLSTGTWQSGRNKFVPKNTSTPRTSGSPTSKLSSALATPTPRTVKRQQSSHLLKQSPKSDKKMAVLDATASPGEEAKPCNRPQDSRIGRSRQESGISQGDKKELRPLSSADRGRAEREDAAEQMTPRGEMICDDVRGNIDRGDYSSSRSVKSLSRKSADSGNNYSGITDREKSEMCNVESDCLEESIVVSIVDKVCTPEDEQENAKQRRKEWQRNLLRCLSEESDESRVATKCESKENTKGGLHVHSSETKPLQINVNDSGNGENCIETDKCPSTTEENCQGITKHISSVDEDHSFSVRLEDVGDFGSVSESDSVHGDPFTDSTNADHASSSTDDLEQDQIVGESEISDSSGEQRRRDGRTSETGVISLSEVTDDLSAEADFSLISNDEGIELSLREDVNIDSEIGNDDEVASKDSEAVNRVTEAAGNYDKAVDKESQSVNLDEVVSKDGGADDEVTEVHLEDSEAVNRVNEVAIDDSKALIGECQIDDIDSKIVNQDIDESPKKDSEVSTRDSKIVSEYSETDNNDDKTNKEVTVVDNPDSGTYTENLDSANDIACNDSQQRKDKDEKDSWPDGTSSPTREKRRDRQDERTVPSSRWGSPKKANFQDLQTHFQNGVQGKNERRKEDRALKGVKGKVSQAALIFNSPSVSSKETSASSRTSERGLPDTSSPSENYPCSPRKQLPSTLLDTTLGDRRSGHETRSDHRDDVDHGDDVNTGDTMDAAADGSAARCLEGSPSRSMYRTPPCTPGSPPDTFYTPGEVVLVEGTDSARMTEDGETPLQYKRGTSSVEGDQHRTKVSGDQASLGEGTGPPDEVAMAPTVEQITDEPTLEKMLEAATIFEDRKKIRARLRELRKQKRGDDGDGPAHVSQTHGENGDTGGTTATTERKRTRATALTVNTSSSTSSSQQSNNTTTREITPSSAQTKVISPVSPAAKTLRTDNHVTDVKETDDGTTKTMTTTSVKTGPGMKSTQVTTMTKSNDGVGSKAASMTQETTSSKTETSTDGSSSKSFHSKTTTSSVSSSSTDKAAPAGKPMSKFQKEMEEKKRLRAEQTKKDQEKWKADQETRRKAAYEKKKQEQESAEKKKASLMDKFGGKATNVGPAGPKRSVAAGGGGRMMAQNPASIKAKLLEWSQRCARGYTNVEIKNFSGSWSDGMAFCAIVHSYYPDSFDFDKLDPKNRRENFDLAFNTAEKLADIYPLLETDDMIMMKNKPDWKCVFTYVQALYRGLSKASGLPPGQAP